MKRSTLFCAVIAAITAVSPSTAQTKSLTLDECIALALQNSRSLFASEKKFEYADARSGEAAAALYPSLKLQASYQRFSEVPEFVIPLPGFPITFPVVLNNYTMKAAIQQPLFTGWKLQGIADNAEYSAQAAGHDLVNERLQLIYDVRSAYWNIYRAQETKRLADENVGQVQLHLNDIQNMEAQGLATRNDVLKVQFQLSNAKIIQSNAANAVGIAELSLNSTLGLPLATRIQLTSKLTETEKTFPQLDRLIDSAYRLRPDIQGMELRVQAAQAGVTAAKGGWWPQIYLIGDYYHSRPNQRIFPPVDKFNDTWDVGVSLQFDLWNNLSTLHQTTEAEAQLEQTRASLDLMKDGITLQVTRASMSFHQAKERIGLSRLGVEQADENYRITHDKFENGVATNTDLLDAENARLQAHLQLTGALVDYELAVAELEKSIGEYEAGRE